MYHASPDMLSIRAMILAMTKLITSSEF